LTPFQVESKHPEVADVDFELFVAVVAVAALVAGLLLGRNGLAFLKAAFRHPTKPTHSTEVSQRYARQQRLKTAGR
jgi:hypothetical protein